jgi:hypothetical protein
LACLLLFLCGSDGGGDLGLLDFVEEEGVDVCFGGEEELEGGVEEVVEVVGEVVEVVEVVEDVGSKKKLEVENIKKYEKNRGVKNKRTKIDLTMFRRIVTIIQWIWDSKFSLSRNCSPYKMQETGILSFHP